MNSSDNASVTEEIQQLSASAWRQMLIHGVITCVTFFLTILSVTLHVTDDYTKDHILMYLFASLMTFVNWAFNYVTYRKLRNFNQLVDIAATTTKLKDISCVGFYETILNFIWLLISIILEAIIVADNVDNDKQAFLIFELVLVICVAFYNLVTTCKTCFRSYNYADHVEDSILNALGVKRRDSTADYIEV